MDKKIIEVIEALKEFVFDNTSDRVLIGKKDAETIVAAYNNMQDTIAKLENELEKEKDRSRMLSNMYAISKKEKDTQKFQCINLDVYKKKTFLLTFIDEKRSSCKKSKEMVVQKEEDLQKAGFGEYAKKILDLEKGEEMVTRPSAHYADLVIFKRIY